LTSFRISFTGARLPEHAKISPQKNSQPRRKLHENPKEYIQAASSLAKTKVVAFGEMGLV